MRFCLVLFDLSVRPHLRQLNRVSKRRKLIRFSVSSSVATTVLGAIVVCTIGGNMECIAKCIKCVAFSNIQELADHSFGEVRDLVFASTAAGRKILSASSAT
jgi:hypothetical protein